MGRGGEEGKFARARVRARACECACECARACACARARVRRNFKEAKLRRQGRGLTRDMGCSLQQPSSVRAERSRHVFPARVPTRLLKKSAAPACLCL
eukprot:6087231-Pleurochrysis_carterae.AAC.1